MGFDDDEEENARDRDLDESQEAQTSTKKKYNNHRLIFFKRIFRRSIVRFYYYALCLIWNA